MSYSKQNFKDGDVLYSSQLNRIEDGIVGLENTTGSDKWGDSNAFVNYPVMSDCLDDSYDETGFYRFKESHENKSMAEVIDLKADTSSVVTKTDFTSSQDKQDTKIKDNSDNIASLQANKANKTSFHLFTIPITGWLNDSAIDGYANYIDISIENLTDEDVVNVTVAPISTSVAAKAQFTNTESLNGVLRLRAKNVPEAAISAQWYIVR